MPKLINPSRIKISHLERALFANKLVAISLPGYIIIGTAKTRLSLRCIMYPLKTGEDYFCYYIKPPYPRLTYQPPQEINEQKTCTASTT